MQLTTRRRDILLIAVAFAVVALYVGRAGGGFPLDDSWIHQTFARNLARYGEWAFIHTQPNAASTSPLYTVLLSIGYFFGIAYPLWTHGLGILGLALTGIIGARLAEMALPDRKSAPLMTGLALVLTWHLVWAGAAGMETGIFGMLTLWLIYLTWREVTAQTETRTVILRGLIMGASVAVTALARPEGILMGGLCALALLIGRPYRWQKIMLFGACAFGAFLVVIAPYLWLNVQLTGGLLPDTASAKFQQHALLLSIPYATRWWNLFIAIMAGGQFLLIFGMVFYGWSVLRQHVSVWFLRALPLLWALSLITVYAWRLPAYYQHGRYVMPSLPALVVCGVIGLVDLVWRGRLSMLTRVLTRTLAIATTLSFLFFLGVSGLEAYRTDVAVINEEMVKTADWIRTNVPIDDLLAIHDIGAVGYFAPRPELLDIAGLISPEVIPIVINGDALWALMQARNAKYLMAFPDQIPNATVDDSRLCLVYSTNSPTAPLIGGANMAVYRLVWDGNCP